MKKIFLLIIIAFLLSACTQSSSSNDEDKGFRVTPGSLTKFNSPKNTSSLSYNNTTYNNLNYGIIFNSTINETGYVGIAVSDNPDPVQETFNMKIYFPDSSIPDSKEILSSGNAVIKVIVNGVVHAGLTGGPITLNFSSEQVTVTHDDTDSSNDTTYTLYTIISGSGETIEVDSLTLTSLNIKALQAGTATAK